MNRTRHSGPVPPTQGLRANAGRRGNASAGKGRAVARLHIKAIELMKVDVQRCMIKPDVVGLDELDALVCECGGDKRFEGGTHKLRLGKITASATAGWTQAVFAWLRAADRRIATLREVA